MSATKEVPPYFTADSFQNNETTVGRDRQSQYVGWLDVQGPLQQGGICSQHNIADQSWVSMALFRKNNPSFHRIDNTAASRQPKFIYAWHMSGVSELVPKTEQRFAPGRGWVMTWFYSRVLLTHSWLFDTGQLAGGKVLFAREFYFSILIIISFTNSPQNPCKTEGVNGGGFLNTGPLWTIYLWCSWALFPLFLQFLGRPVRLCLSRFLTHMPVVGFACRLWEASAADNVA